VKEVPVTVVVPGTPKVLTEIVTATPAPEPAPAIGGTLLVAQDAEPDTLDGHNTAQAPAAAVLSYIGASLVTLDPDGKIVPYLAERWEASDDSLTWDFILKQGITFHDGAPLTAHDYARTFQRALNPETSTGGAIAILGSVVASVEALDDYTLRFKLNEPFFPFLVMLTDIAYFHPMSQAWVEEHGDQYGFHPMSVGPYKFKEWVTGDKIVLERNPDFAWGPSFVHQGPWRVDTIEIRIIPEHATIIAGLETGEIDYAALEPKDVERIQAIGEFQIFEAVHKGLRPVGLVNNGKPPFDDIRVRQAFNLAVDRAGLIRIVAQGSALPAYGPLSPTMIGYWPGVEYIGYGYDLGKAKALMAEAGYTAGATGTWEKDGQPFKLNLKTPPEDIFVRTAQVLQQQYEALGVEVEIESLEMGVLVSELFAGDYELALLFYNASDCDWLYLMGHSSNIGVMNIPFINDPELDEILARTRAVTDPDERQETCAAAQRRMVEQAQTIPLYLSMDYTALSDRVQGAVFSDVTGGLYLDDAYINTTVP
jgi:peptide/nickel transport system substrate-binding protein